MRVLAPGFLLGVCVVFYLKNTPSLYYLLPLLMGLVLFFYGRRYLISKLCFSTGLGVLWLIIYLHSFSAPIFPKRLEGKPLSVTGYVVSLPVKNQLLESFVFLTKSINHKKMRLKLSWYHTHYLVKAGEQWRFNIKLKRPHGLHNPGGFDYSKWAFQQGISATGYIINKADNRRLSSSWFDQPINRVRATVLRRFQQMFPAQPVAGFLVALTLGSRAAITQQDWQVLQRTGTSHLVAISGLHIGLVASLIFFLVSFLWRRSAVLTQRIPAQQVAAVASLFVAMVYCALAGFALPTQRALLMLSVVLIALILKRRLRPWHALSCALFLVLLLDPLGVLSISFWLSFSAVAVIVYGISGRLKQPGKWRQLMNVQLIVTIGLIPLTIYFFQKSSVVSPLANLIAIPWVGLIVVPLSLLGAILLLFSHAAAQAVLWLALKNMQGVWWYLNKLAGMSFAAWHYSLPTPILLICLCIATLLLLAPRGLPIKYLAVFFLLPVIFISRNLPAYGEAKLTLLDVGQGLSVVIQTQHHTLVYDTGPGNEDYNAGDSVLIPFLRASGINKVNTLVISHTDNDHVGGAKALLSQYPVRALYTSNPNYFSLPNKPIACHARQHWDWDGVHFNMLYPPTRMRASKNNRSCVLQVSMGDKAVLLTGDIEKPAEIYLVTHEMKRLPATILIAPHHGSKTSSSWPFIRAVHPHYILFPTGYRNRFHFPSSLVLMRYNIVGAKALNTANTGAISFTLMPHQTLMPPKRYAVEDEHLWNIQK